MSVCFKYVVSFHAVMFVMPFTLVQGWPYTWWTLKPNLVHTEDEPLLKDGLQVT